MLMELLRMEQGSKGFNEFLAEVEDYENLIGADEKPLDSSDLKRISLLAGMKDRTLAEKALAEDQGLLILTILQTRIAGHNSFLFEIRAQFSV